ncbi:MAG TPA: hypothetical protein PLI42_03305 [Candidatus Pacearchaeota archaeon]|nr:hypothetical protein [Bacteroidales bacterium]HOS12995.1 hypothetical protein [Candidatus Pacearchaeota archaeon]
MKFLNFIYKANKNNEIKNYQLLTLEENDTSLVGISLTVLSEEKRKQLEEAIIVFENAVSQCMEGFRRFNKSNIQEVLIEKNKFQEFQQGLLILENNIKLTE